VGIEPERIGMMNLSSAMGSRFAELATEMTEQIRRLGPSRIRLMKTKKAFEKIIASENEVV
jgi:coenzyme F420-reducing hydrogenase delta subunit